MLGSGKGTGGGAASAVAEAGRWEKMARGEGTRLRRAAGAARRQRCWWMGRGARARREGRAERAYWRGAIA